MMNNENKSINFELLSKLENLAPLIMESKDLFLDIVSTGQKYITSEELKNGQGSGCLALNELYNVSNIEQISDCIQILLKMFRNASVENWNFADQYEKLGKEEKEILG